MVVVGCLSLVLLNWDSQQGRPFSLPSQRNFPISFKPKVAIAEFFWKMQRKTWYSILGLDTMPLSLKNLLLRLFYKTYQISLIDNWNSSSKIYQIWYGFQWKILRQLFILDSHKSDFKNIRFVINIFQFCLNVIAGHFNSKPGLFQPQTSQTWNL